MLEASTWSSLIIKVNGSRELDNRFKLGLGRRVGYLRVLLSCCIQRVLKIENYFCVALLELFFGFEWLCLEDR